MLQKTLSKMLKVMTGGLLISGTAIPAMAQTDTIDVMVLYTSAAAQDRNGAMDTYINSLIDSSNATYRDSNMRARIRLVHSQQINVAGTTGINSSSLDALRNNAQVNELRAEHGADLVALMSVANFSGGSATCGIGYVGNGSNGTLSRFAKSAAFSISGSNCGSTTFTHELGHNMGLGHSRRQGSSGGVFNFGVGYGVDSLFATTMAYSQSFNARSIERFSNPSQTCSGVPCGISSTRSDGSDAVSAVNSVSAQIANYLPTSGGNDGDGGDKNPSSDPIKNVPSITNNLITNASAESGLSNWDERFNSTVGLDSTRRFTGENSLKVSDRQFYYSGVSQDLVGKLNNGGTYKISASIKLEGSGSDVGRMALGITDANGTRYIYFNRIGLNSTQWTPIDGEFTLQTSGGVSQLFLLFYGPSAEKDFYVDQVSLVPVGASNINADDNNDNETETIVVRNGDFETATAEHWEAAFNGEIGVSNRTSNKGVYSLGSFNRTNWYDGIKQGITSRIENDSQYQLSAWVRMSNTTQQNVQARLYFRDNNGHNWKRFDTKQVGATWTELNGQVDINASGEIKDAQLYFFGPTPSSNFYVDDVVLKKQ